MRINNTYFNTQPLFLHLSGPDHFSPKWYNVRDYCIGEQAPVIWKQDEITIVTYVAGPIFTSGLTSQLDKAGVIWLNIAQEQQSNQPWDHREKIKMLVKALPTIDTRYVLALDAKDVLLTSDISDLTQRFKSFGCQLLYSGGIMNFPPLDKLRGTNDSPWSYVNSGMFMGETEFLKTFYGRILSTVDEPIIVQGKPFGKSDQTHIKLAMQKDSKGIAIDIGCKLFQNLNGAAYGFSDGIVKVNYSEND